MKFKHALRYLPFIDTLQDYSFTKFRADIISGLTVAIVALPQSMAYAMIAGVHPKYGLYAAIIPTIVSALFGSSRFLIAGPTNAISMVVASTLASTAIAGTVISGMPEEQKIGLLFLLSFLVGVIQLALGLAKVGKLVGFISHSVIVGFTAGAGILIAFNQLKNLLGISFANTTEFIETAHQTFTHLPETNPFALAIGLFTITFILTAKHFSKSFPGALVSMILATLGVVLFDLDAHKIKLIGEIPRSLNFLSVPAFSIDNIRPLFGPALAIALLGVVEALSIAKSIASSCGDKINGNQEFIGQGLSNVSAAFFSSIPGSGSFTRSAVNFRAGAKTRLSAVYSGLLVLITLIALAPYARFIPIASLAGILMVIAYAMVDQKAIALAYKATRSDRIVMIVTLLTTIFLELEFAIYVGVILSIALFLRKVSQPHVTKVCPRAADNKLIACEKEQRSCPQVSIYQIDGSLFFGAIEELERKLSILHTGTEKVKAVIIRMKGVQVIDATSVHSLEKFVEDCRKNNMTVIFTNVAKPVLKVLRNSGALSLIGERNIAADTTAAITQAYALLDRKICHDCPAKVFKECQKK